MKRTLRRILLASALNVLPVALPVWICPPVVAQTLAETAQGVDVIPDFKFDGVDFNTTVEAFKKSHTFHQEGLETNKSLGIEEYLTMVVNESATTIDVKYYKGELFMMVIHYNGDATIKLGGASLVYDRLVQKYGPPDDSSLTRWNWVRGNTRIQLRNTLDNAGVTEVFLGVGDDVRFSRAYIAKQKSSNVGF